MFRPTPQGPLTRIHMASTLLDRPVYEVSAYAFADLLIDSGPPQRAAQLVEWCRGGPVRRVVLTHHHEDHVGGAAALQEELGLPILAPVGAVPILAEGLRIPLYRRAVWRSPRRFRAEPLGPVVEGEGYRLRVVPTPGHAFSHVCLFDEERRWLFSGDLYVHERVRYLRRIESVRDHLDSLRKVLALEPELLICDHAGILDNAAERLARKIGWWEDLGGKARELRDRGLSVEEITRRLLGREGLLSWLSLGDFSHRNLIRELIRS
ncbi:MAG TPA: MBL fold metallo-hydrolase [Thermoanaerobaculia bacterium]|nr:MBL fold metallo-hydrolase [Thermoanaerobaculia bacterium]